MDIFEAEVSCRWVAGFDDVEEMAVGVGGEEVEGGCGLPVREEVEVEVRDGVAFDSLERGVVGMG